MWLKGGIRPKLEASVTSGVHDSSNSHRYRKGRLLAAAVLAGLLAVPATAAASQASATQATAAASCPWVTSTAPIDQRVAQLMSNMSLADKITMVEGHGSTNPYVFYAPAIPSLCIPAVGLEDGPAGVADAVAAAKSASVAVVVVSDDTESEATDRPSLNLPSAQDELISAVAAANPHTVVVINAGAPVVMPWLNQVAAVVDAWYPGQSSGTALASVLFGRTDPSGHLPVTFPQNLSQVPASTTAQFPGNGTTVQYSEGLDVGYRWYNDKNIPPLFPFGYGLSYTKFAYSNLRVTPVVNGTQDVRVSATVRNIGRRSGAEVAQLYVTEPAAAGEPPRQLKGFQRVNLAPGQSTRVQFTVTPADISWFDPSAPGASATGGGWSQTAGAYQVYVGDSSALANLPLHGWFLVTS